MDLTKRLKAMEGVLAAIKGLDGPDQALVLELTARNLGLGPIDLQQRSQPPVGGPLSAPVRLPPGTNAKVFMAQKKPGTDVNRIAALAYYLTHYKNTPFFKTKHLTTLASSEAAQPKFSNAAQAVANATRAKLLAAAEKGQKQITARGEALVDAMPDEALMKAALTDNPAPKRRARGKRKTKAKSTS